MVRTIKVSQAVAIQIKLRSIPIEIKCPSYLVRLDRSEAVIRIVGRVRSCTIGQTSKTGNRSLSSVSHSVISGICVPGCVIVPNVSALGAPYTGVERLSLQAPQGVIAISDQPRVRGSG